MPANLPRRTRTDREASGGEPSPERIRDVTTTAELAALLRQLRRRYARARSVREPSYRAIAAKTGWSLATVGDYFTGRTLPPTDRFDVLVGLLGATGAERGALATARDRVAERSRGDRSPDSPAPRAATAPGRGDVPRQLPADVPVFTGRAVELSALDGALGTSPGATRATAATARTVVITGAAGVGKPDPRM